MMVGYVQMIALAFPLFKNKWNWFHCNEKNTRPCQPQNDCFPVSDPGSKSPIPTWKRTNLADNSWGYWGGRTRNMLTLFTNDRGRRKSLFAFVKRLGGALQWTKLSFIRLLDQPPHVTVLTRLTLEKEWGLKKAARATLVMSSVANKKIKK